MIKVNKWFDNGFERLQGSNLTGIAISSLFRVEWKFDNCQLQLTYQVATTQVGIEADLFNFCHFRNLFWVFVLWKFYESFRWSCQSNSCSESELQLEFSWIYAKILCEKTHTRNSLIVSSLFPVWLINRLICSIHWLIDRQLQHSVLC